MTIFVNVHNATPAQSAKILSVLRTKFQKYHNESLFERHCKDYGILKARTDYEGHMSGYKGIAAEKAITIKQFLVEYGAKKISLKNILNK